MIILDAHFKSKHLGASSTINYLRNSGWWIPKIGHIVYKTLKSCAVCRLINSKPFKKPNVPSLPSEKVNFIRPFYTVGIDYTGYFNCLDTMGNKIKTYLLIFTCYNTRAIHLEVVNSMTVEDFVLGFIRFSNRYGIPATIYSDNAKTFSAGKTLLQTLHTSDIFKEKFGTVDISFKNIPIYAAWYGATWERMIKTVKECLYKSFGKHPLPLPNFITAISDIQLAVNNRPLSYCSREGSLSVVTPNHLVSPGVNFPSVILGDEIMEDTWDCENEMVYKTALLSSLESRDRIFNRFKNLWYSQYLLNLRGNLKSSHDDERYEKPYYLKKGSVVLHKHPTKTKPYWSLAIITELLPSSSDGKIRVVKIRKSDGSEVTASIINLYPLELEAVFESRNARLPDREIQQQQQLHMDREKQITQVEPNNINYVDDYC